MDALDTCNACDLEVKTPNKMGYCDECLKGVVPMKDNPTILEGAAVQHTPTPWKKNGMTSITTFLTSDGPQATVDPIADVYHPGANQCLNNEEYRQALAKAEANASLIVRAVNAHNELLAALKGLLSLNIDDNIVTEDALKAAKLAVAKADGK